jgi:2-polyprenyl-3-methyl-5-hydroxy-6-metoxy-1,4-benzoquinol methylase
MGSHTSEAVTYANRVAGFQMRPAWNYEAWKLLSEVERHSLAFSRFLNLSVLDYGCGPGQLCRMVAGKGATVVGVDTSHEMLARAQEYGHGRAVSYERMDRFVPVHLGDFDLIFCLHVLGHVPNVVETLIHLRSRLKKNGRIVILNPNKTHTQLRKPYNWLRGFKADPTIKHRFNLGDLEHLAGVAGLRVEWSYMTGEKFLGVHSLMAVSFVKA